MVVAWKVKGSSQVVFLFAVWSLRLRDSCGYSVVCVAR